MQDVHMWLRTYVTLTIRTYVIPAFSWPKTKAGTTFRLAEQGVVKHSDWLLQYASWPRCNDLELLQTDRLLTRWKQTCTYVTRFLTEFYDNFYKVLSTAIFNRIWSIYWWFDQQKHRYCSTNIYILEKYWLISLWSPLKWMISLTENVTYVHQVLNLIKIILIQVNKTWYCFL